MAASQALRNIIEHSAPRRPWSSNTKSGAHVRPLSTSIQEPYMQLNQPSMASWLLLDLDYEAATDAWMVAGLPPPTFVATNPENGHAQYGYALASPVCTSTAGRSHPVRYLAAIEAAYVRLLKADARFAGNLVKNPLHPAWRVWEPANAPQYELGTLAECVTLPSKLPTRREATGVGRNCSLFDDLSVWAYRAVRQFWSPGGEERWIAAAWDRAEVLNVFDTTLPASEIKAIARSVSRWVWRNTTPASFRESQAMKGSRKGLARRAELIPQAQALSAAGHSNRKIAIELGVDDKTIGNWLNNHTDSMGAEKPYQITAPKGCHGADQRPVAGEVQTSPKSKDSANQRPEATTRTSSKKHVAQTNHKKQDAGVDEALVLAKAWAFFDASAPGQRAFWQAVWDHKPDNPAISGIWPLLLLTYPPVDTPDGPVRNIEIMVRRLEASWRACGHTLPWEVQEDAQ